MTITKYDGVAIIPKRCNKCNRLFWLEPYNVYYKEVGIEHYPLKQIECKNCIGKAESEIHCNCTDEEIAKSFISDVDAVKDLLPRAESEDEE